MYVEADDAAIQSDAYIDALLGGHARRPIPLTPVELAPPASVRHVIRLLESGLPRFHPSFLFEERLAAQLRGAGGDPATTPGEVRPGEPLALDRRLLMGGALASGLSIGAAAMLAWRRRHE